MFAEADTIASTSEAVLETTAAETVVFPEVIRLLKSPVWAAIKSLVDKLASWFVIAADAAVTLMFDNGTLGGGLEVGSGGLGLGGLTSKTGDGGDGLGGGGLELGSGELGLGGDSSDAGNGGDGLGSGGEGGGLGGSGGLGIGGSGGNSGGGKRAALLAMMLCESAALYIKRTETSALLAPAGPEKKPDGPEPTNVGLGPDKEPDDSWVNAVPFAAPL